MGKSKKAERKHLSQTGTILFNGTLTLQLKGKTYQVRTEYHGLDLQRASQNHEVIVLIKQHLPYDEIDTGYIVRAKEYDKQHCFGLKATKDAKMWAVYNYSDVIAWGYADGGLNDPTLFYSCQSTVEEEIDRERRRAEKGMKTHAERLAEMEAEMEERLKQNERPDGLVVKLRDKDGNIDIETSWPKAKLEDYLPFVKDQMADCFKSFDAFRKAHPEFHEMHFLTDHTVWEKDLDEEAGA